MRSHFRLAALLTVIGVLSLTATGIAVAARSSHHHVFRGKRSILTAAQVRRLSANATHHLPGSTLQSGSQHSPDTAHGGSRVSRTAPCIRILSYADSRGTTFPMLRFFAAQPNGGFRLRL